MEKQSPLIIACYWLSRAVGMHIVWFGLTLCGGIIFGFFPATVVIATMTRRYLNKQHSISLKEVWKEYKAVFVRSNKVGWAVALPMFSLGWYAHWLIVSGTNWLAVIGMSLLPIIVMAAFFLYVCLLQISLYEAKTLKQDLIVTLRLINTYRREFVITNIVAIVSMLIVLLLPVVLILFGFVPVVICSVTLLWHANKEFQLDQI
ncbi:DUF624 domain-containing protein [Vibrio parahaemolyticus]|nr:DUF624 domain-containing protein [Vibrio parahaemolyticus]